MAAERVLAAQAGGEFVFLPATPETFAPHFHDYWLVGRLGHGCHEARLQSGAFILDADCLLLLNPGDIHACSAVKPGGTWEALHIFPEALGRSNSGGEKLFGAPIMTSPALIRDFCRLAKAMREGKQPLETFTGTRAFIENLAECPGGSRNERRQPDWGAKALALLSLSGASPSLEKLAAAASLGKYRFVRLFSRHYGISPHRYLVVLRLNQAKKLLSAGFPTARAAQMTGFYDQAHFTKTFKASFGYTPGECRRFLGRLQ